MEHQIAISPLERLHRGSSGNGDDFIQALIGQVSYGEYEDVMAGVGFDAVAGL